MATNLRHKHHARRRAAEENFRRSSAFRPRFPPCHDCP
jgi:hypothetical protein